MTAGPVENLFAFPLSFAQQRLWFLHRLQPDSPFYNTRVTLALTGELNLPALQQSLDALVARHEALRTTFRVSDGEPVQIVSPPSAVPLPVTCVDHLAPAEALTTAQRMAAAEGLRPFDLERGPLLRAHLYRVEPREHVLVLTIHHIVCDGWSAGVLHRELGAFYRGFVAGQAPDLPDLPVQYPDFSVWQREWMSGPAFTEQLEYWRKQLDGAPAALDLPADRPRPSLQSYQGAVESLELSVELPERLRSLGQREGATLFMTLLAGFALLLSRYAGREDVVIGTPIANRTRSELEDLIGFFVNSLALRTDLSGDPTFRGLLARVRDVALGAYAHQDLPFERLVQELRPERVGDRNPFFQVMFSVQNAPRESPSLPGLALRSVRHDHITAKFDLTLHVSERPDRLELALEYATDLFDAATIRRMLGHYRRLLEQAAASPESRLSSLTLLTAGERRLLDDWTGRARPYPGDLAVHRLFESEAARRPEAVALVAAGASMSYGELDRAANRLARHLVGSGVGPGDRVGIALERSPALAVATVAALKAGAAYVPLDSRYPVERLRLMVEDAAVAAIVSRGPSLARLAETGAAIVDLDGQADAIARQPADPPEAAAGPDDLAYIMYTSGSTGRPKGVAVPHRAIARLVRGTDYAQLGAEDAVAQVSNASFDAITFEMWGALLNGGRLVFLPQDVLLTPAALEREIHDHGVTAMFITSALFQQLAAARPGVFRRLHHLLYGGETIDPGAARTVLKSGPPKRLLHAYGPTECTTFALTHEVQSVPEGARIIPIGRPIANTTAYILDRRMQQVPCGIAGELYLGGPGVARGYWRRAALTAERFVPDPWAGAGSRLYRTGDRARWLPDGTIEFIGRLDQQVKLRGFRIEPGEVEAALAGHPAVRECAVIVREDTPGDKRLVAYVVIQGEPADTRSSSSTLRAHLRGLLPEHMVPSAVVVLERLPLTPNGKLDRRALPRPADAGAGDQAADAPGTMTELRLAAIWRELLDVPQVGSAADFFELGGHSLLAVKLFARMEQAFGQRLPLAVLFRSPTLRALAAELDAAAARGGRQPGALVPLQPLGDRPPLFIVHNIWGDLLRYRPLAMRLGTDQPVFGFEHPVEEDGAAAIQALEDIAASYVRELRELQPEGPYHLCGYCAAGALTLEIARQLQAGGARVALLAVIDGASPDHRTRAPLGRRLVRGAGTWLGRTGRNLRQLPRLPRGEIAGFLRERLRNLVTRAVGVPAFRLSVLLRRPVLPALRERHGALSHAVRIYRPGRFEGRIVLMRSSDLAGTPEFRDQYLGWDRIATGGVEVQWVAGEHLTMMQEPFVAELATRLRECMDRSSA